MVPERIVHRIVATHQPSTTLGRDISGQRWSEDRCHIATSKMCSICHGRDESLEHVLRDCFVARRMWLLLIKPGKRYEFFHAPLNHWLICNIQGHGDFATIAENWDVFFVVCCWMIGKNLCSRIFGDANVGNGGVLARCLWLKNDIVDAVDVPQYGTVPNQEQERWQAPSIG
ncbi:hypothetical protein V6N13_125163 [Hibiscus sabdariffa]